MKLQIVIRAFGHVAGLIAAAIFAFAFARMLITGGSFTLFEPHRGLLIFEFFVSIMGILAIMYNIIHFLEVG